jgi:hypothetical protein
LNKSGRDFVALNSARHRGGVILAMVHDDGMCDAALHVGVPVEQRAFGEGKCGWVGFGQCGVLRDQFPAPLENGWGQFPVKVGKAGLWLRGIQDGAGAHVYPPQNCNAGDKALR